MREPELVESRGAGADSGYKIYRRLVARDLRVE